MGQILSPCFACCGSSPALVSWGLSSPMWPMGGTLGALGCITFPAEPLLWWVFSSIGGGILGGATIARVMELCFQGTSREDSELLRMHTPSAWPWPHVELLGIGRFWRQAPYLIQGLQWDRQTLTPDRTISEKVHEGIFVEFSIPLTTGFSIGVGNTALSISCLLHLLRQQC